MSINKFCPNFVKHENSNIVGQKIVQKMLKSKWCQKKATEKERETNNVKSELIGCCFDFVSSIHFDGPQQQQHKHQNHRMISNRLCWCSCYSCLCDFSFHNEDGRFLNNTIIRNIDLINEFSMWIRLSLLKLYFSIAIHFETHPYEHKHKQKSTFPFQISIESSTFISIDIQIFPKKNSIRRDFRSHNSF